jgi:hypothetical protein
MVLHCPPNALNNLLAAVKEWRDARTSVIERINAGDKDVRDGFARLANAECVLKDWSNKWQHL